MSSAAASGFRDRLRSHISRANSERLAGEVARITSTASSTGMALESPFMLVTAVTHCCHVFAPLFGLYCLVFRPIFALLSVRPVFMLQLRHVQIRFCGSLFSSCPSTWPTSIPFPWAFDLCGAPQKLQRFGGGGAFFCAR